MIILDKAWQKWIIRKQQDNCPHDEIFAQMLKAGVNESTALFNLVVFTTLSDQLAMSGPSEGFEYEPGFLSAIPDHFRTSDGQEISMRMRMSKPEVVLLDNFLTHAECDALREQASSKLIPTVIQSNGQLVVSDVRIATGAFLDRRATPVVETIETRIAELTGKSIEQGEKKSSHQLWSGRKI
jgi:prolyl 4-hydroxylase